MTGDPEEATDVTVEATAETDIRARILDASAEAFMRAGYAGTTIDDLAREVGATKGLIYYHFRSKFDVFLAVYAEGMARVRARVEPWSRADGRGAERLAAMARAHLANLMEDLAYHHAIHQGVAGTVSAALRPRQRQDLQELSSLRADYEDMFRAVLQEGLDDGSVRPVDPRLATRTLLCSLNAVDTWFRPQADQPEADVEALAAALVDLVVGGLLPATAPPSPVRPG
ncbi:TetR/AcrR family transcriptional regulator [Actinomycetospora soli]|uniref:TetR/AcrR family transcriptional regulator n=1 Tax=Actinomycetospora soli TaxID=2893887 RepID=UPI001E5A8445|nr:TetR/AcrR family transcriptional regulator [Actinomycetospora soli]MCD2189169.1 TetR/AcrR family transcriptional regulator [Actinomycetospora soli]